VGWHTTTIKLVLKLNGNHLVTEATSIIEAAFEKESVPVLA